MIFKDIDKNYTEEEDHILKNLIKIIGCLYDENNGDKITPENTKKITKFIIGYYFCFCLKDLRYSGKIDEIIDVNINLEPFSEDEQKEYYSLLYIVSMINDSHHDKLFDTKDYNYIDLIEILLGKDTIEARNIFSKIFQKGLADFNTKKTGTGRDQAKLNPDGLN